jgi:hypothetical protein
MPQKGQTLGNRAAPARAAATVTTLIGLVFGRLGFTGVITQTGLHWAVMNRIPNQ